MKLQHAISETLQLLAHTLFPYTCALCGKSVPGSAELCASCWHDIEFVTRPACDRCGAEVMHDGLCCTSCLDDKNSVYAFDKKRAFAFYTSPAKEIVAKVKHLWHPPSFALLSKWTYACASDLWPKVDVIVPVPSHWTRILQRGYNPAKIIAYGVARLTGIAMVEAVGCKMTPKQQDKTSQERLENVKDKFYVTDVAHIAGKRIALIDDVTATGATLHHASLALKNAEATSVICITPLRTRR